MKGRELKKAGVDHAAGARVIEADTAGSRVLELAPKNWGPPPPPPTRLRSRVNVGGVGVGVRWVRPMRSEGAGLGLRALGAR